jgi:hypothetical protein
MTPSIITAQFAHFFMAAFIVAEVGRFAPQYLDTAVFWMVVFAAIKEFVIDSHTGQSLAGQFLDFGFYTLGATIAGILSHL